jgi:hypothetical protein
MGNSAKIYSPLWAIAQSYVLFATLIDDFRAAGVLFKASERILAYIVGFPNPT